MSARGDTVYIAAQVPALTDTLRVCVRMMLRT
jgi:hypothetical protein